MNPRSNYSRSRESKLDASVHKSGRNRHNEDDDHHSTSTPLSRKMPVERSLSSSSYSRYKDERGDKTRLTSRDNQNSLVFRRQERGKFQKCTRNSSTPETSPGRSPHSDSIRGGYSSRHSFGSLSHYRGTNYGHKEYAPRRSEHVVTRRILDDSRFLIFLARLQRDEDRERQASSIRQLKEIFAQPENFKVICTNLDVIIDAYDDLLQVGYFSDCKREIVASIGMLGAVLGSKAKKLLEWIFQIYNTSKNEEIRILVFKSLLEMLKNDKEKQNMADLMAYIMLSIQSALEVADNPDLLMAIVDIIFEISDVYPKIFSNHFSDTVDILIGWHIDMTQQPYVTAYTSKALIHFQQFWLYDINFTLTLLGQFLEDMESYAEDLPKSDSLGSSEDLDQTTPGENLTKIYSLVRVLTTVLKSIGYVLTPDDNGPLTWSFMTEMLKNFLSCVMMTIDYYFYFDLVTSANQCLCLLLKQLQSHSLETLDLLVKYITTLQNQNANYLSEQHILSSLQLMAEFVKTVDTRLPVEFVTNMFTETSLTYQLSCSRSSKVQQHLISLQHAILNVKNVQAVELFYEHISTDAIRAFETLSKSQENTDQPESVEKALALLLSCLSALVEIGNAKHSIIRMWALKPTFFELMTEKLKPTYKDLALNSPLAQYAILFTLYSHSQRHKHFVSSSSLVNRHQGRRPQSSSGHNSPILTNVLSPPQNSEHLINILTLLVELLNYPETSHDSKLLGVQWSFEIIENLQSYLTKLVNEASFCELISAIIETARTCTSAEISKTCCLILQKLLQSAGSCLAENIFQRCYELCIVKLNDHDSEIQEHFASLLALLPINVVISGYTASTIKSSSLQIVSNGSVSAMGQSINNCDTWTVLHTLMNKSYSGTLPNHHFKTITAFILQGTQPQNDDWLLRLMYSCPLSTDCIKIEKLNKELCYLAEKSLFVLWFWSTWQVAQACVVTKLRTPLGKPQETFMAIEMALKSASKPAVKQDSQFSDDKEHRLFRVCLLLQLMEHLEKLMYNAYEGCAYALPSSPKAVRAFFRTNKGTCQEWLSRVRMTVCSVALNAGQPAIALRNGYELLMEMKNGGKTEGEDFETVLMYIMKALVSLRCPEAILGLYIWCKEKLGQKLTWIKAAVDHAAGRFELASHEYFCILHSLKNSQSPAKPKVLKDLVKPADKLKNGTSVSLGFDANNEDIVKFLGQLSVKDNIHISEPDPRFHLFLINQITECYINLGSWTALCKWIGAQDKLKFNQNGLSTQNNAFDNLSYLRALTAFEDDKVATDNPKNNFSCIDSKNLKQPYPVSSWIIQDQVHAIQKLLLSAAVDYESKLPSAFGDELEDLKFDVQKAKSKILQLLKIACMDWPPQVNPLHASLFVTTASFLSLLGNVNKNSSILLNENIKLDPVNYCCSTLVSTIAWQNILNCLRDKNASSKSCDSTVDLLLISTRLARKQQNLKLSQRLLLKSSHHLIGSGSESQEDISRKSQQIDVKSLKEILYNSLELKPSQRIIKMQREGAKLLHSAGDTEGAYDFLLQSCLAVSSKINEECDGDEHLNNQKAIKALCELNSRSLLTVVKYLQQDNKNNNDIIVDIITQDTPVPNKRSHPLQVFNTVIEIEKLCNKTSNPTNGFLKETSLERENIVGEMDYFTGRLLMLSVSQCPSLPKAWCTFASWCYRWGKKVIDAAGNSGMDLLPEEKSKILSVVPNASREEVDALLNVVTSLHRSSSNDWDSQEMDYAENGIDETRQQLLNSCPFVLKVTNFEEVVETLLDVWKTASDRVYYYYKMAAKSYLQYLKLNGEADVKDRNEDDNVTATLRLLRLVVKHASELREVLEDGLAETPTAPWRGIIPQLFSRLNHPEPYVRQSISDLLCRVAQASPHLIVYPAVVGSLTLKAGRQRPEETSGLFGAYFPESIEDHSGADLEKPNSPSLDQEILPSSIPSILSDEEETEEDHRKTAIMQNCFAALVETLGRQDGRTISEVKSLVHELHRITLLWDELWLGTLNLHHSEVSRRISNLEKEITKVMNNTHLSKEEKKDLIREKHNVYIKPTIFVLEQLQSITSQPAETPHEQWFQKTFEKNIETALFKLKNPIDPSQPQDSWMVFRKLHQVFQQKLRQVRSPLQMEDISPALASLNSTVIPMPGITKKDSGIVTIQSVNNVVPILPTKTKPKKLAFIGSDGHKYGYLFKGLEDLHLDERIMQFLSIVNNMFAKNKKNGKQIYNARHYSVTPLGPRSGLIQWVDGATALFSLYKKWQQREAVASTLKGQNSTATNVLRPSEIYYNKLTPLLKEKGLSHLENRKEWPLSVLLDVMKELMEETPNDLLAKELWCYCCSASEWWNVTQTYNHSTAVMSVIGYIIGLGDRHLDNVLVDLSTGEVVHIDYNVCFEKGKNLRVPEKVPFRMTPNIETALGVTGVEGVFRVSCEHVLKVLRKGRETLLTLLEAFVYDPLVDWTPGNDGGYTGAMYGGRQVWSSDSKLTRQDMEVDIAWSMFSIRVTEMKGEWIKNRDELLAALPKLENLLEEWEKVQLQLQVAESQLQEACLEKALLEEAQSNPNHHLYTLPKRFEEITVVKNTVKAAQESVKEKSAECTKWHNLHCEALSAVCGVELTKWCNEAASSPVSDTLSVAPVAEFLQTAGQGQLVQQCEHLESELGSVLQQHRLAVRNCVDLLTTYATIVKQFGPQFKEHGRSYRWREWLENLLKDFTVAKCQETVTEFHTLYNMESVGVTAIQSAVSLNFQLQDAIAELNSKLHTFYERQLIEGATEKTAFSAILEETKCAVLHFVSENNQQNHLSLLCIFVTAFCGIYKRLMMMEKSALAAGDSLVDLTSYSGYWFLDEMCNMCSNTTEFVRLLIDSWPTLEPEAKASFNGVHLAYCIFTSLEDLTFNFQNIILPEALQRSLEPSVIEMIAKLDRIIARCGVSLDRLITELEANTRNIILETQITENWVNDVVKKLRNEFESLMKKAEPQISDLNQGQMLLMGFNGLFTKLDSDLDMLLNFLDNQTIPAAWKKLDVFRDTVAFAPFVHNHATRSIMKDIYFLRKLIVIQQFFHYCHEYVTMLQCINKQEKNCQELLLVSEYPLVKPVKLFTAEYVRHMVLGLPTQALGYTICLLIGHLGFNLNAEVEMRDVGVESKISIEDITKKAVDICANEHFLQAQLSAASELTSNFDSALRKVDITHRIEQNILVCKSSLQRMQLQLARFQWLNEDFLVLGNIGPLQNFAIPTRASVMSEMRKIVQALLAYDSAIALSQERYLAVTSSIEQRLKWAKGANPSLSTVQEEFEAAIDVKNTAVSNANQLSRELVNVCNAILHFEALRTRTTEALSSDTAFLNLITRCQESCMLAESCKSHISSAEENLVEMQPLPDKGVNSDWITNVMEKVSKALCSSKEKLEQTKAVSFASWDTLSSHVAHLHDLLSSHHKLMSEVRHILRNLAKHEEQDFNDAKPEGTIFSYITVYKQFSEQILSIVSKLLAEGQDIGMNRLSEIKEQIPQISISVSEVFNKLLELAGDLGNHSGSKTPDVSKRRRSDPGRKYSSTPQTPESGGLASSLGFGALPRTPQRGAKQKKAVTRDPRTGKAIQERNSYATNVWKRVKVKLDGRDPDPSRKSTISEQVDFIIKEATNLENLAVLYEGWTPWV